MQLKSMLYALTKKWLIPQRPSTRALMAKLVRRYTSNVAILSSTLSEST